MRTFFYRLCVLEAQECGYGGPEGHIAGLGNGYLGVVCGCIRGEVYGVGGGAPACGYPACVGIDAAHDYFAAVHGEGHSRAVNFYLSGRLGGGGAKGVAANVPQRRTGVAGGGSAARGGSFVAAATTVNLQRECRTYFFAICICCNAVINISVIVRCYRGNRIAFRDCTVNCLVCRCFIINNIPLITCSVCCCNG